MVFTKIDMRVDSLFLSDSLFFRKGTQPTADGVLRHHQMQFECSLIIGCPLACGLAAKCPVVTEPLYRGVGKRADFAMLVLI